MKKKILVVDDDPVNRLMLSGMLEKNGFQVLTARDGEEALNLTARERPEAVITDVLIPKLDGLALCQAIKENPELSQIKVILMTAVYKTAGMRAEALAQKADAYVEKPISEDTLFKTISSVL
ncbi:MAG: response regulator [Candidatus Saccharicenans sp.]